MVPLFKRKLMLLGMAYIPLDRTGAPIGQAQAHAY